MSLSLVWKVIPKQTESLRVAKGPSPVLVLLDVSAAFDTVKHQICHSLI